MKKWSGGWNDREGGEVLFDLRRSGRRVDVEGFIVVGCVGGVALKAEGARGGVEAAPGAPWCGLNGKVGGEGRAGASVAEWHAASRWRCYMV